ncbi:MAG: hypothetical protein KGD61_10965 [Candidatus Lokiarchaeota archaeon]|nr:hypothetical protein [Candidatus Lokiarchaeota archaeon]
MEKKEWKKYYYIKSSKECAYSIPMGMEIIGISKFIHWYRFHRDDKINNVVL